MSNAPSDSRPALKAVEAPRARRAAAARKPGLKAAKPAAAPDPESGPESGHASGPEAAGDPVGALAARPRPRHWLLLASFVVAVLLPVAASVWYLWARAADQYHSETAFSIRSEEMSTSAAAGILGALTQAGTGSASDTDILFDFIRSQEIVVAIDDRLDLRAIFNRAPDDPVFTLGDDPSIEALVDEWNRMVTVDLESHAGIIHVRANAFTSEDATAVARAILDESSALVNRLSEQAREDAVRFAREELDEAEDNLRELRARLSAFRRENRIVDPQADLAGQMGLLNALQGELAQALVERDQLMSYVDSTEDPRVIQAERRISAITRRIDAERTSLGVGGSETALSEVVGTYEELRVDLEFANTAYTTALAALTAARAEARRQSRYLAPHVAPTTAEQSLYPRRPVIAGLVALFATLGWGILMLVYYNVRDSR